MESPKELVQIIEKSGVPSTQASSLLDGFGDFFVQAHKIVAQSKVIKVTGEDQLEAMSQAREFRLQLKTIRVSADKVRAELKEGYLRGGNAVQDIFNDIRDIVKPEEERLEEQEKFAEVLVEKRRAEKIQKRTEELSKYVEDVSVFNVANLSTETFEKLLISSKETFEAKQLAIQKEEEERIKQANKEKVANTRRDELYPYIGFVDEKMPAEFAWYCSEEEYQDILKKAKKAKTDYDSEQEKIRQENEEMRKKQQEQELELKKEREEKEKIEAKLREERLEQTRKQAAEEAGIEKRKAEEIKAGIEKALAPDREKLRAIASWLGSVEMPFVQSEEAKEAVTLISGKIRELETYITQKAATL